MAQPILRLCLALALVAALAAGPAQAQTYEPAPRAEPTTAQKAWDLVILRPLDFLTFATSAVFFVVAYPVTLVTGGKDFVREVCWDLPVQRTFKRPLGEL